VLALPGTGEAFCAAFRPPDGHWLVTGGRGGDMTVWDLTTRQKVRTYRRAHQAAVSALAFSPDGRLVASAGMDTTVKVWDATTGELLRDLREHELPVLAVAFSPDGQFLASGGLDTTVKVWIPTTGIQAVASRLKVAGDGKPRLFLLRNSLVEPDPVLIDAKRPLCTEEEINAYVWDTSAGRRQGEVPIDENNHGLDALRYLVARFDGPQARPVPPPIVLYTPQWCNPHSR
jgi:WD40 repeat protein